MVCASGRTSAGVSRRVLAAALTISLGVHALLFLAFFSRRTSVTVSVPQHGNPYGDKRLSTLLFEPSSGRRERTDDSWLRAVKVEHVPVASTANAGGVAPQIVGPIPGARSSPGSPGSSETGQGSSFFGQGISARSVVYVIDRSLSMGPTGALARARTELLASLYALHRGVKFQVIFYTTSAETLLASRPNEMLTANTETVQQLESMLAGIHAQDGTDHVKALRCALAYRPDLILLVTDADDLTAAQVEMVTRCNKSHTTIHAIDVGNSPTAASSLQSLANRNHGTYRHVTDLH